MAKQRIIRILTKGGILTPGYLLKITDVAKQCGNTCIHFGSRQDVVFSVRKNQLSEVEYRLKSAKLDFEYKGISAPSKQNIVSSFVTNGVLEATSWMNEGAYLMVLDSFDYAPQVQINIIDPKQNLQPLYNGLLNFIASDKSNYWHLVVNQNGSLRNWPKLIHSSDVVTHARWLEYAYLRKGSIDIQVLEEEIRSEESLKSIPAKSIPEPVRGFFPYYEGIHKMNDKTNFWAGFYWRNNNYSIAFIDSLCKLCLKTGIAKISITPWKTFMVKGIRPEEKIRWEQLVGRYGINMRHSSFELNWHMPLLDEQSYKLKRYLVKQFDKVDVRTYGLSFSIDTLKTPGLHTSIHIRRKRLPGLLGKLLPIERYDIEKAKDFNPNKIAYNTIASNITREDIAPELIDLTKRYYLGLGYDTPSLKSMDAQSQQADGYQCTACLSIYSPQLGDPMSGIDSGTSFEMLPANYCCYTCGNGKEGFKKVKLVTEKNSLHILKGSY